MKISRLFLLSFSLFSFSVFAYKISVSPAKLLQDTIRIRKQENIFQPAMACFYLMNEKYQDKPDFNKEKKWIENKILEVEKKGTGSSLFSHTGGGPNGAEWNPSNDLLIVFTSKSDSLPHLQINGKDISGIKVKKHICTSTKGYIFYCRIPRKTMILSLRKIQNKDLEPLFGKEKLKEIKESSPAPPNTGKIIEFTFVQSSQIKCTAFFHAAFGE